ncbi:FxSxx-COOH system tetratricopeptide repeat protein [Rhizocola hellebori]|uniref:FxSxx-COOH system tetratricopeptide repeat protein n=1 Tax=Rhizocola hellebori TaxID=1392758 RepID=UPI001943A891|nr:FxSxx-COOH system tetratricopeptide repeat protein [Rhizocola hellebori]
MLAAVNVSTLGDPDVKVIVKVCPPGPYAREPTAHRQAKASSSATFYAAHLVEQIYSAHPINGGGMLMFQEIATATLDGVPLSQVPDDHLARSCGIVVHGLLAEWNSARIRTSDTTVGAFLQGELRGALNSGGSVHALAKHVRLLEPEARWILDAGRDGHPLPNPAMMASDPALGAHLKFDVIRGPAHGDLHLENVLIPQEYGQFEPQKFRLVDLSTFEDDAPVTRDPVTLMLSVIAPSVSELRADEQEALLDFVLEPWPPTPPRLSTLMAHILEVIYRTGNEAIKAMRLGDWRSQYLLSVQATATLFTSFESVGEAGRWWFLRLAARAGAAFLRRHHHYHPGTPVSLRRPLSLPSSRSSWSQSQTLSVTGDLSRQSSLLPTELATLLRLLAESSHELLTAAYHATSHPDAQSAGWENASSLVELLQRADASSAPAPPLLIFVDQLAHLSTGSHDLALHRWLSAVGRNHGYTDETLRQLCSTSLRASSQHPTTKPLWVGDTNADDPNSGGSTSVTKLYPNSQSLPGGSMISETTQTPSVEGVKNPPQRRQIVGSLPAKNPAFTGRDQLLRIMATTLNEASAVSVIPQALHGLGGVGKTQLATEFVHRNLHHYEIVWWMSAEDPSLVRASLVELARKLQLPAGEEVRQTIALVLDALATSTSRWLLVYDNVDSPDDISGLVPSAGGHVIITSRNNAAWATGSGAVEVDVFERSESVKLLQLHGKSISDHDAARLAEKLGDLPLALEQAAIWHASTGMPVSEYLELFDKNLRELLSEGRPSNYPDTIYGILKVAVGRLRTDAPAAAELLELFAFLGAEPISVDLLRAGRGSGLSEALAAALDRPIELNRVIRELRRFGLARVDTKEGQRVQVHRLVQRVLREELVEDRLNQARSNAQRLLSLANPGYPDVPKNWPVYKEIFPHIHAAELLDAPQEVARTVVLDEIRYLFKTGDYLASKMLGETTLKAWEGKTDAALGLDQELVLIASRLLADALRLLGEAAKAHQLNTATLERLRNSTHFGEDHEHTLNTANGLGVGLRMEGRFVESLAVERDNVERHVRVWGDKDQATRRAQNNLAVSLRHLGRFEEAFDIDQRLVSLWRESAGDIDTRTLFCVANFARDQIGLGKYRDALEMQRKNLEPYRDQLGLHHGEVLMAARTITITLRKSGYYADARDAGRDNYHDHHAKFGKNHEHTLSARMSYANALRCCSEFSAARAELRECVDTYRSVFGDQHPFTLAANVNLAIALRSARDYDEAAVISEHSLRHLTDLLGPKHPYTIAAANGRANGLALSGDVMAAGQLSAQTFDHAREIYGEKHPVTLACAVNAARDDAAGGALLDNSLSRMRETLGADHPEVLDAARGERMECDIEPPPT